MPIPINTRVTPALHPDSVKSLDGFDDIAGYGLSQTVTAFEAAYQGISDLWDARDTVNKNGAWTEDRRIVELSKLSGRKWDGIAKAFDTARANLLTRIKTYEDELTAPVVSKAASSVAAEIRKHVKDLSTGERIAFFEQAMKDGDAVTLSALLGAPAYLSGLTGNMQKAYLRQHHERMEPEKAKRLKVCQAAADLIMERGALVSGQLEKAVGASVKKATELRRRHEAATKALA